jgi:protein-tyrosine phosphatase
MPKRVLFLCTGNYYRSRFAEYLFNHHARELDLPWEADSRALAIELGKYNVGPISPFTRHALAKRGIHLTEPLRSPQACEVCDLETSDLVVALKEAEHRAYMKTKFPGWEDRITYWHVHDLDQATPEEAMEMIERLLEELIAAITSQK